MSANFGVFNNAADVAIKQSQITLTNQVNHYHHQEHETESNALTKLSNHCAFGAFLNSIERADPPRCSPKTRVRLIGEMTGWATSGEQISSVMWLTGSAGSGKTALGQTTAEELKKEGRVLGCHFFYRTSKDGKRSDGYCWVPNMVHQMIRELPETLPFVKKAIRSNDSVFDLQPDCVFEDLFLGPLRKAVEAPRQGFSFRSLFEWLFGIERQQDSIPRLVVVDGLDECKSPEMQVLILQIIANAIPRLPIPLRFLIASRPETHIRTAMNEFFSNIPLHPINLDEDQDVRKDLEVYYHDRFDHIRRHHPALRGQEAYADWPSQADVSILVRKSSTQFIFASTVMNYISHPRNHPVKRLQVILGIAFTPRDDRPYFALDTLYTVILLSVAEADREIVWLVLSLIYLAGKDEFPYMKLEASPKFIEDFLGLDFGDVARLLDPLVSLLTLPETPSGTISMLHASFFDYFRDPVRSEALAMRLDDAHEAIAAKLSDTLVWSNGRGLHTTELNTFLYHASHATGSQRLVLILYGLQDDMACEFDRQLSSPNSSGARLEGELRSYMPQVSSLLFSKWGKLSPPMMPFSSLEGHRHNVATMIIRYMDERSLFEVICSAAANRKPGDCNRRRSGRLSLTSCVPLIKRLMKAPFVQQGFARELLEIFECPEKFGDWDCELAQEVLAFLNYLLSQLSRKRHDLPHQLQSSDVDDTKARWRKLQEDHERSNCPNCRR